MKQALITGGEVVSSLKSPETLAELFRNRVERMPEGLLWVYELRGEHRYSSYQSLWSRSAEIAGALSNRGCVPGTPVILLLDDALDFVPAIWACFRAGCIAVPLQSLAQSSLQGGQLNAFEEVVGRFEHPVILGDADSASAFRAVAARLGIDWIALQDTDGDESFHSYVGLPDDIACLIPTSGTTAAIKLVALSQRTLINRFSMMERRASAGQVHIGWFPMDSVTGMSMLACSAETFVYLPTTTAVGQPLSVLDAIEYFRVTYCPISSFAAERIHTAAEHSHREWDLSSLTQVGIGAETVVVETLHRFIVLLRRYGANLESVATGYGSTEMGLITVGSMTFTELSSWSGAASAPLGGAVTGVSVRIVDDGGLILDEGVQGHIQVLAAHKICSGYYTDEGLFERRLSEDGWFKTGDIGVIEAGILQITGRDGELIIVNAKKRALAEIETILCQATGVRYGQIIACSIREPGASTEALMIVLAASAGEPAEDELRALVLKRFGIAVRHIVRVDDAQIPRTENGKMRRRELAEQILGSTVLPENQGTSSTSPPDTNTNPQTEIDLSQIWARVLKLRETPELDSSFFDLGGDSLRFVELITSVEQASGVSVPIDAFVLEPTLRNLAAILKGAEVLPTTQTTESAWSLPDALARKQKTYISAWQGERHTQGQFLVGLNTNGNRPPICWVFQGEQEFSQLARHLGPDQPLYGLRSGHLVMEYDEDSIQQLALCYVHEILEALPSGPMIIAGNCQAAVIALAIAQHLQRRRRAVPLLILMEWTGAFQPYSNPVLLLSGDKSQHANPYLHYYHPEKTWNRMLDDYKFEFIQGEHGDFFSDENVPVLASVVKHQIDEALAQPLKRLPIAAYRAQIKVKSLPRKWIVGKTYSIEVRVRNESETPWSECNQSGLMLGNRWLDNINKDNIELDGRVPLPALNPGEEATLILPLSAPQTKGEYQLLIDVVEEGNGWFARWGSTPFEAAVVVGIGFWSWVKRIGVLEKMR